MIFFLFPGEFLAGQLRHVEAAVQYVRAAELRPRDYDLATSAATALRQAGRGHEAEIWYKRAVAIRPQVNYYSFSLHQYNIDFSLITTRNLKPSTTRLSITVMRNKSFSPSVVVRHC